MLKFHRFHERMGKTSPMEILLSLCAIFVLYFFAWVANGSLPFVRKYSHSSRLFLCSLVYLGMFPVFVFLYKDDKGISFLMLMILSFDFVRYSFLANEKMHEELVSGYKEEKERKKEKKRQLRERKKMRTNQVMQMAHTQDQL